VNSLSFFNSSLRAASHSAADTAIGDVFSIVAVVIFVAPFLMIAMLKIAMLSTAVLCVLLAKNSYDQRG
jgi:hypothetical protein